MRRLYFKIVLVLTLSLLTEQAWSWGFFAHKRINRMAVFTLPPSMIGFYKEHIDFVAEHAIDPDRRRYAVDGEATKHYIDIDHYDHEHPFDSMPRRWKDAVAKYSEDTLKAYGIVPWNVSWMVNSLTDAFKAENFEQILKLSADLGHYVGDAHVPLHTTENYNGQLTGQRGIHGFWESRLPELKAEDYDYLVGRAKYINNVLDKIWDAVEESHSYVDSVLLIEADLNNKFPSDQKYAYETRGRSTVKTYSKEYSEAYHARLNGMVEARMRKAIIFTGSLWYTAWVNAGQPDLSRFNDKEAMVEIKEKIKQQEEEWKQENVKSRNHEH